MYSSLPFWYHIGINFRTKFGFWMNCFVWNLRAYGWRIRVSNNSHPFPSFLWFPFTPHVFFHQRERICRKTLSSEMRTLVQAIEERIVISKMHPSLREGFGRRLAKATDWANRPSYLTSLIHRWLRSITYFSATCRPSSSVVAYFFRLTPPFPIGKVLKTDWEHRVRIQTGKDLKAVSPGGLRFSSRW